MLPDPSAIRNALAAKLGADVQLLAAVPNGVYYGQAPVASTRFVLISLVIGDDASEFGRRSIEDRLYHIEAVVRAGSGGDADAAAARIDALLDPQPPAPPATLNADGYSLMLIEREEPVDFTERDEADKSIVWYRRGGRYRVVMSVNAG